MKNGSLRLEMEKRKPRRRCLLVAWLGLESQNDIQLLLIAESKDRCCGMEICVRFSYTNVYIVLLEAYKEQRRHSIPQIYTR